MSIIARKSAVPHYRIPLSQIPLGWLRFLKVVSFVGFLATLLCALWFGFVAFTNFTEFVRTLGGTGFALGILYLVVAWSMIAFFVAIEYSLYILASAVEQIVLHIRAESKREH